VARTPPDREFCTGNTRIKSTWVPFQPTLDGNKSFAFLDDPKWIAEIKALQAKCEMRDLCRAFSRLSLKNKK
jgi:hypothetical protein